MTGHKGTGAGIAVPRELACLDVICPPFYGDTANEAACPTTPGFDVTGPSDESVTEVETVSQQKLQITIMEIVYCNASVPWGASENAAQAGARAALVFLA